MPLIHRTILIRRGNAPSFTLVELMISIALVLLLMAGVTAVFKATSDTVSTGLAIGSITRDQRGTEHVLDRDFSNAIPVSQQPCIVIISQQQYAYMNANDQNSDRDGAIDTIDNNGDGKEGDATVANEIVGVGTYNSRNHRIDRVMFFGRDFTAPFQRQTGNQTNPEIVSQESSSEAWIQYGHVLQPTNLASNLLNPLPNSRSTTTWINRGGDYYAPGWGGNVQTNPNNFYVNQWVLGRSAMVLKGSPAGDYFQQFRPPGTYNYYYLAPLAYYATSVNRNATGVQLNDAITGNRWYAPQSRFDVAGTSASQFLTAMRYIIKPGVRAGAVPRSVSMPATVTSIVNWPWYQDLDYRFNCKPWVQHNSNPLTPLQGAQDESAQMALTTPFFQKGVSQFIVEYAGDFVAQDENTAAVTWGDVLYTAGVPNPPDGQIDYVIDKSLDPSGTTPAKWFKRIRWYGMPRHTDGPLSVATPIREAIFSNDLNHNVLPIRDVANVATGGPTSPAPFEHFYVENGSSAYPNIPQRSVNDYADPTNTSYGGSTTASRTSFYPTYVAAWSPADLAAGKGPKLIRIVITLTDPSGRLPEGQTFEYVYALPQ